MIPCSGEIQPFRYERPETESPKKVLWLARTDRLFATMQVIRKGGETNLHSHSHLDGFWYVLAGRGRFYSDHTKLACEIGPNEGVLIPRGVKYWFEAIGDDPLELIQVECSDVAMKTGEQLLADRTNFSPMKRKIGLDSIEEPRT